MKNRGRPRGKGHKSNRSAGRRKRRGHAPWRGHKGNESDMGPPLGGRKKTLLARPGGSVFPGI